MGSSASAPWYRDFDSLLQVAQRTERQPAAPRMSGYEDLRELRRGGQGVVYVGVQSSTRRRVAIKVLLDGAFSGAAERFRFEREIDLIAGLRHPHIVRLYDSGITPEGNPYFVMDYIEGASLDETLRAAGALRPEWLATPERTLRFFLKLCEAINFAHQRGVIHRDLKPSNVRVTAEGEPHVLDFGLGKRLDEQVDPDRATPTLSRTGVFMGSLPWASPEQVLGQHTAADVRTDVYALGVILFQLLTGVFPYDVVGPPTQVAQRICDQEPSRPSRLNSGLDSEIDAILLTALDKQPERRYQGAGDLSRDIRRYLNHEPILARPPSAWYQFRKFAQRNKALVGGAITATVLLTAGTAGTTWGMLQARAAQRVAETERDKAVTAERRTQRVNEFLRGVFSKASPDEMGYDVRLMDVVTYAADHIDEQFLAEPLVAAGLHDTLGRTYRNLGLSREAESHLARAAALYAEHAGASSPEALLARGWLGLAKLDQDRLDEAEWQLEGAYAAAVESLGPGHGATLRITGDLGHYYYVTARYAEAEALYREALELLDPSDPGSSELSIRLRVSLAHVRQARGDPQSAADLLRAALDEQRAIWSEEHPNNVILMNDLGRVLRAMGDPAAAEEQFRACLELAQRVLGPEHPGTLAARQNLITSLVDQNRGIEASEMAESLLETRRRVVGSDHYDTLLTMGSLGVIRGQQGRYEEQIELARGFFEGLRRVRGDEHPDTLAAQYNLASAYMGIERYDEAEEILLRLLIIERRGEPGFRLCNLMNTLGVMYTRLERYDDAVRILSEGVTIARSSLPTDHYFTPWIVGDYGKALTHAGRYAEAEHELLDSYRNYKARGGDGHSDTQWAIGLLIHLYTEWDRPVELARFTALRE